MIAVDERDRDVLRFLWIDDVMKGEPEVQAYRFTRVVFNWCVIKPVSAKRHCAIPSWKVLGH